LRLASYRFNSFAGIGSTLTRCFAGPTAFSHLLVERLGGVDLSFELGDVEGERPVRAPLNRFPVDVQEALGVREVAAQIVEVLAEVRLGLGLG
jgi:hypothetical protein